MKKILITGAGGNVGRLLRPILRERYKLKVTDIADFETTVDEISIRGDLADREFCDFAAHDVDGIVHLAGLVGPGFNFEQTLDPNYRAVLNLLESCRIHAVERLVFASSHHAVGMLGADTIVHEELPIVPDSFYGLSKAFGEAACAMYAHRFGIRTMLLRIGNADPLVVDARRERMWTSGRDLASLIDIGLEHPNVRCEVVYAASNCPEAMFNNRHARSFGYCPKDDARDNHAPSFKGRDQLPRDQMAYVGGHFAVNELPNPWGENQ
ncbi:NAD(P)-dependent oxidoreductase [Rhizobium vallis]|uniref:NAD(P)-dependent oxidoreductase n=1 Tax=Rhizobium vallis TaxID=634290 RepID=A0A3S0SM29_9HYPH|nr:NAD(P)-dependent oxidoreductase [Rhizobium vallis]RUM20481.1 NAD(P)-dependent oxidoreductase [Rhizobium vallis]